MNQAPAFLIVLLDTDVDEDPSFEMPLPYMMSNSHWRNGGATLFLTT